jgi:hypothetical protein
LVIGAELVGLPAESTHVHGPHQRNKQRPDIGFVCLLPASVDLGCHEERASGVGHGKAGGIAEAEISKLEHELAGQAHI